MSKLHVMVSILDRRLAKKFLHLYKANGVTINLMTVARGTANSEMLDYFGLESIEKIMMTAIITDDTWHTVKKGLTKRMNIDIPGTGIVFLVPLSSIGGKRQLDFLTEKQHFVKEEETTLKDTKYELLVVIANQGYTDLVMTAARSQNAGGGTVIHAKGTGLEGAEKFLGVSLASEKEIILIVVKHTDKNKIMKAIMEQAGLESKAKSIVFSLPVTSTAGMRLMEISEEYNTEK